MKSKNKFFYILITSFLLWNSTFAQSPCTLTGAVVNIPFPASPIMMHAAVNGMSQYSYQWSNGTTGAVNQVQFYSGWCVTITDVMTGCDTTICESCLPTGGMGVCPMIYAPVCGCDGNIYSNDCIAMYNGIFTYSSAMGPNGQILPCPQVQCNVDIVAWPSDTLDCINGGTISLEASSGFDTYFWSTGDTSHIIAITAPGIYYVSAVDSNGCQDMDTIEIFCNNPCYVTIQPANGSTSICDGDTIILLAVTNPSSGSFIWDGNPNITTNVNIINSGGYHTVEFTTASGCVATDSIFITIFPPINLSIYSAPNPPYLCLGDSIVLEATSGFVTYNWNNGMSGDRIVDFPTQDTWYLVEITDSNGCVAQEDITVYVDTCSTGFGEDKLYKIEVFPNPSKGDFFVHLPKGETFDVFLYDLEGKLTADWKKAEDQIIISNTLTKGVYLLQVKGKKGTDRYKLIKE